MAGVLKMPCHSLEVGNRGTNQQAENPANKITHALVESKYELSKVVDGSFAAAHPFWECFWAFASACVMLCVYV